MGISLPENGIRGVIGYSVGGVGLVISGKFPQSGFSTCGLSYSFLCAFGTTLGRRTARFCRAWQSFGLPLPSVQKVRKGYID